MRFIWGLDKLSEFPLQFKGSYVTLIEVANEVR